MPMAMITGKTTNASQITPTADRVPVGTCRKK
jgi:hypothetical protein